VPPRDWRVRVADILSAVQDIESHRAGLTAQTFELDRKALQAVLFNLVVIGEAARNVPDEVQKGHPEVPWADMCAMRNFVAHGYFAVSPAIVWATITEDFPVLVEPLRRLLEEAHPSGALGR
jgi:uncharacterized protein with HEPN domain